MHDDALLGSPLARELFHGTAAALPIIDYHGHLDLNALATDRSYADLDALSIAEDPYKHRLMRSAGVPEAAITGAEADSRKRFDHWARTLPLAVASPLAHWQALELRRVFGIDRTLTPASAAHIWDRTRERLAGPDMTARALLRRLGVAVVCTSDRLLDDLVPHRALAGATPRVIPSLRGDDLCAVVDQAWHVWCERLTTQPGLEAMRAALAVRLDTFAALGCRIADHALDDCSWTEVDDCVVDALLRRRQSGEVLAAADALRLRSGLLREALTAYARLGWTVLLHIGAQRRTSSRLRRLAGPAGGYAGIAGPTDLAGVTALLDACERAGGLPRCVLFPLNPADWPAAAVLTGSFAADGVPGLMQFGPAWWWDDHAAGIRQHLDLLAGHGLLGLFVGMTTDARTIPSQVRHEYFRRLLCDWLARQAAAGAVSADPAELAITVRALCHGNAANFLGIPA